MTIGQDVISDHRHQLDTKLASLTRMVVEDTARTKQGLDSLYRRLVTLVVLRSGLGNPTDPSVVAEANTCLSTVFPVSGIDNSTLVLIFFDPCIYSR